MSDDEGEQRAALAIQVGAGAADPSSRFGVCLMVPVPVCTFARGENASFGRRLHVARAFLIIAKALYRPTIAVSQPKRLRMLHVP